MKSTVFGYTTASPSASAVNFLPVMSVSSSGYNSLESTRQQVVPSSFTMSSLYISLNTAPGTLGSGKSLKYTLRKNNADTALVVIISETAISGSDNSDTVSFAAGDLISISVTPTGTPTLPTLSLWNFIADSGATHYSHLLGGAQTTTGLSTTVPSYANISGASNGTGTWNATQNLNEIVVPTTGTINNLFVKSDTAPGTATSFAVAIIQNGSATALSATVSGTNTTANDTSDSFSVAAGDTISVQITPTGTPTVGRYVWGMQFTPTNPGESFFGFGNSNTPSNTATTYEIPLSVGNNGYNSTEAARQLAIGDTTITAIYGLFLTPPGLAASRTLTMRQNANNTAAAVTISGTNTTGSTTGVSVVVAQSDLIALQLTLSGSPTTTTARMGVLCFISPGITTNQTISGLGRIAVTSSQTIQGVSRVQLTTSKTTTGLSRISKIVAKTIAGLTRVTAKTAQTILGNSRITQKVSKTLSGETRITVTRGRNLLFNGDFEINPPVNTSPTTSGTAWIDGTSSGSTTTSYGWAIPALGLAGSAQAQFDINTVHNGTASMRLSITSATSSTIVIANFRENPPNVGNLITEAFPTVVGAKYTVVGWIKTNNAASLSGWIDFRHFDSTATNLATTSSNKFTGTNDWTRVTFVVTAQGVFGAILLRNGVAGNISDVWFDDVAVYDPSNIFGVARITAQTMRNQNGVANIAGTTKQTISGHSRIQLLSQHTTSGHSRIQKTVPHTLTGLSNILHIRPNNIQGVSRVLKTFVTDQTISGHSYICVENWQNPNPQSWNSPVSTPWEVPNELAGFLSC